MTMDTNEIGDQQAEFPKEEPLAKNSSDEVTAIGEDDSQSKRATSSFPAATARTALHENGHGNTHSSRPEEKNNSERGQGISAPPKAPGLKDADMKDGNKNSSTPTKPVMDESSHNSILGLGLDDSVSYSNDDSATFTFDPGKKKQQVGDGDQDQYQHQQTQHQPTKHPPAPQCPQSPAGSTSTNQRVGCPGKGNVSLDRNTAEDTSRKRVGRVTSFDRIPRSSRVIANTSSNPTRTINITDSFGRSNTATMNGGNRGLPVRGFRAGRGAGRGRGGLLQRANTERLTLNRSSLFRNATDPSSPSSPRPSLKQKSRSMSMTFANDQETGEDINFSTRNSNFQNIYSEAFAVALGASREQAHYQPRVIRKSRKLDLQTGGETQREVICQRIIDYPHAMDPAERRRKIVLRRRDNGKIKRGVSIHGVLDDVPQYRLQSKLNSSAFKEQIKTQTVQPGFVTTYLTWSLQANFVLVLLSEACAFLAIICGFALFIYLGSVYQPECLRLPDQQDFEEGGSYFIDAFALSWTTFSTVGYGMVHPQVRKEPEASGFHCAFMTAIVSLESFVGVLFASFCGAVIVGKMTRAKSTAAVRFSKRIILRFGTGVMFTDDDDDRCNDQEEKPVTEDDKARTKFPCPALEFRIANTLHGNECGEIMNAKINVFCSTLYENEPESESEKGANSTGSIRPSLQALKGMKNTASQFIRTHLPSREDSDDPMSSSGITAAGFLKTLSRDPSNDDSSAASATGFLRSLSRDQSNDGSSAASASKTVGHPLRRSLERPSSGVGTADESTGTENPGNSSSRDKIRRVRSLPVRSKTMPFSSSRSLFSRSEESKEKQGKSMVRKRIPRLKQESLDKILAKKRAIRKTASEDQETETKPPQKEEVKREKSKAICVEEDPTGDLVQKKLFTSLKIECDTHPFFKRVWTVRHTLEADSPLLSAKASRMIREARGFWPAHACNSEFLRENIQFQQLIVSLSGTTGVSGCSVYGLHVYDYPNLHVGYTFAPVLDMGADGKLVVDLDSIDNIRIQRGGGAEPIDYYNESIHKARKQSSAEESKCQNAIGETICPNPQSKIPHPAFRNSLFKVEESSTEFREASKEMSKAQAFKESAAAASVGRTERRLSFT